MGSSRLYTDAFQKNERFTTRTNTIKQDKSHDTIHKIWRGCFQNVSTFFYFLYKKIKSFVQIFQKEKDAFPGFSREKNKCPSPLLQLFVFPIKSVQKK